MDTLTMPHNNNNNNNNNNVCIYVDATCGTSSPTSSFVLGEEVL